MSRALRVLAGQREREEVIAWIKAAPVNTRVELKAPVRSLDQNSLLWSRLTEVAQQVTWHGLKLTPTDWKTVFTASLKTEVRIVPNVEGTGFVQLGHSTSDLSKAEFTMLLDLIEAFGVREGVKFRDLGQ